MGVGTKLTLIGAAAVLLSTVLTAVVGIHAGDSIRDLSTEKIRASVEDGLRSTATSTLNMVRVVDRSPGSKGSARAELRKAIMQSAVGKTGYIWVLGGDGDDKGRYIISKDGKRDGENVWQTKDADGTYCIQEMINGAEALPEGQSLIYRYNWIIPGEAASRTKIAAVTCYEPWHWVIGIACYEDELYSISELAEAGRSMVYWLAGVALFSLTVGILAIRAYSRQISQQLTQLAASANALSLGDLDKAADLLENRAA